MKKIFLLTSITLLSIQFTFGQKVWHNTIGSIAGPRFNVLSSCGDTLINGETWTILESGWANNEPPPLIFSSPIFTMRSGMIQEKNGMVEYRNMAGTSNYILYDYHLLVGDSITPATGGKMHVTKVDSIMISNQMRKRISLYNQEYDYKDVWIEGIGSINNYFLSPGEPKYIADGGSELICFSVDGNTAFSTGVEPDRCLFDYYANYVFPCQNSTTKTKEDSEAVLDLKVFPNPFNEVLNLESAVPFNKVEIYDLNGKLQFRQYSLNNLKSLELINQQFSNGIYLLKATAIDGTIARTMIVKNRE